MVGMSSSMCWSISSIVSLKTLTPPSSSGLSGREDVVEGELGDLREGRLELELRVVVRGAQDVDELRERRVAVDRP